jgi:hypothetical protein
MASFIAKEKSLGNSLDIESKSLGNLFSFLPVVFDILVGTRMG